jgi:hypothetical protein
MTTKSTRCQQMGVCQGLGADKCPDCDSFECEVACPPEQARPTYPFAPGVIQGPDLPIQYVDEDGPWLPLSTADTLKIVAAVAALFAAAGYLVERLA